MNGIYIIVGAAVIALDRRRHHLQGHVARGRAERGADHLGPRVHGRTPPTSVQESLGFKIVTGKGTLVFPGVQVVRRLSLDLREADLAIECVTHQGIPLGIRGVVIYKVGDDFSSIANAARRFLDQQAQMDQRVHNVFTGHLRAIVGNMTVEEMIRDREKLTAADPRVVGHRDGEARPDRRLAADPGDRGPDRLHQEPRPSARRGRREPGPHRPGRGRPPATETEQEAEALKAEARRDQPGQAGRLPGRGRPGRGHRPPGRPAVRGPGHARRSSSRRPRSPSSRPSARSSGCRPPCASRPTPRPTRRSRWPGPSATPASPQAEAERQGGAS